MREKRKESIVIHGLKSTSIRGVNTEFGELTRKMTGTQVELTDIVPITGHTGLYRGKILNEDDRKLVLDKAKTLKGTDYDRVYIRKDLTYNQRCALKARRDAYRSQQERQPSTAVPGEHPAPTPQESAVQRPPQEGRTTAEGVLPGCEPTSVSDASGGRDCSTSVPRKPAPAPSIPASGHPPQSN